MDFLTLILNIGFPTGRRSDNLLGALEVSANQNSLFNTPTSERRAHPPFSGPGSEQAKFAGHFQVRLAAAFVARELGQPSNP